MSKGSGRGWLTLGLMSTLYFMITVPTFGSLGMALPAMVAELHWNWAGAGFGFTLLGFFCGITSAVPASLIRRFGVRATLLAGAVVMMIAFLCFARTHGLILYLVGASLAGLGFTLLDSVPGTYLVSRLFARPSFAIGLFFTVGGLGGVAGPLLYSGIIAADGGWRSYWLVAAVLVGVVGLAAALFVDAKTDVGGTADDGPEISHQPWTMREALTTGQFWIIAAAYVAFQFCGITASAVSVAHLTQHGVAAVIAGSMMSVEALLNSGARLVGGILTRYVSARMLLCIALASLIVGMLALGMARTMPLMLVYAAGIGIGYGLTLFAATILLLDYFGRGPYLELFSTVNLISTVGAAAPTLAGFTRDETGGFMPFFVGLSLLVMLVLLAAMTMRPPRKGQA